MTTCTSSCRWLLRVCLLIVLSGLSVAQSCDQSSVAVNYNQFEGSIVNVVFASANDQDVYLLTSVGNVYRSLNGGQTWSPQMDLMEGFYNTSYSASGNQVGVIAMQRGAQDGLMFFVGGGYVYWITRGDGLYKAYPTGADLLLGLSAHPTNGNLVLRLTMVDSCQSSCSSRLELSQSQGIDNSWVEIATNVYQFAWGGNPEQIYFIGTPEPATNYLLVPSSSKFFYLSNDLGATVAQTAGPGVFSFNFTQGVIYALATVADSNLEVDVYLSYDFGESYVQARFIGENAEQHHDSAQYIILDNSEGVSFVSLCSLDNPLLSDLYQTDLTSGQYWLSFPHLRSNCSVDPATTSDFLPVQGLNGIYVSNGYNLTQYDNSGIDHFVQTGISFDKGAEWVHIPGVTPSCQTDPECGLHLFGPVDNQQILSNSAAIGLVLATGVEGRYRNPDPAQANTYLSRNGGYSWEWVRSGWNTFQISPRGDLFVLATKGTTNQFSYSYNQGVDWIDCLLRSPQAISVDQIILASSDPNYERFFVLGSDSNQNGVVVSLDFSLEDSEIPWCIGFDAPSSADSDYESFTPSVGGNCLLGEMVSYVRRKQQPVCWSPHDETSTIIGVCECTRQDYTCAGECWSEQLDAEGNIICFNICQGAANDPQAPPDPCIGTYLQPRGYRLVEGDVCHGGLDLWSPVETYCPGYPASISEPSNSQLTTGGDDAPPADYTIEIIVGIIALIVVSGLLCSVGMVVVYFSSPKVRTVIHKYLPAKFGGRSPDLLYSVLGEDGDLDNSLFFGNELNDTPTRQPVSTDKTKLAPLPDIDDGLDDALDLEF